MTVHPKRAPRHRLWRRHTNHGKRWWPGDDLALLEYYATGETVPRIGQRLMRTAGSVNARLCLLRRKKNPAYALARKFRDHPEPGVDPRGAIGTVFSHAEMQRRLERRDDA